MTLKPEVFNPNKKETSVTEKVLIILATDTLRKHICASMFDTEKEIDGGVTCC